MKVSPKAPQRLPKGPKGPPKSFFVIVGPQTKNNIKLLNIADVYPWPLAPQGGL